VLVNGLLVQNVVVAHSPNAAFWSMAVEAQLYLLFPIMLLTARRWGPAVMLGAVAAVVVMVGIAGPHIPRVDTFVIQSAPDLAALFAIGVLTAGIVGASAERRSWPWPRLALAAATPVVALIWWQGSVWTLDHLYWVDLALGPAIACLLAALATGRPAQLVRVLDARPLRRLGSFSYSLYLIHAPIVAVVCERIVAGRVAPGVPVFLVSLGIVLPVVLAFAWAFAAAFEAPLQRRMARPASASAPARGPQPRPRGVLA
jgi:peptidoglycan/LPS O-acetylase OafA/YrhL